MRTAFEHKKFWLRLVASLFAICAVAIGLVCCAAPARRIRITIGMWPDAPGSSSAETRMFEALKERFERDYPQYEIVAAPYRYSESTVTAKATAGQLPTVFAATVSETKSLAHASYVVPITHVMQRFGWADKIKPEFFSRGSYDGELYAFPHEESTMGLFANLALLYEAGVIGKNLDGSYRLYDTDGHPLYPTTLQQLAEMAKCVATLDNNATGMILLSDDTWGGKQLCNLIWNFGGAPLQRYDGNDVWVSRLNSAAAVSAAAWVQDLAKADALVRNPIYLNYPNWYMQIGSLAAAMAFCQNTAIGLPFLGYSFSLTDLAFFPMPYAAVGGEQTALGDATAYFFSAKATPAQIEGALLFLKYMGKSPDTDEVAKEGIRLAYQTQWDMGMPIIPSLKIWSDPTFLTMYEQIEEQFLNVPAEHYFDFMQTHEAVKRDPEPNFRVAMYKSLDAVMQQILANPDTVNVERLLGDADLDFQLNHLSRI